MAQIFIGRKTHMIDLCSMATSKEFVNTLEDVIRKRGAMDLLITDSARVETSDRVKDILRALCIDDWQSEAYYQHQNYAEHRWHHFKNNIHWIMNLRNVDANAWFKCAQWVADVMNHTAEKSLGWRPPLEVLTGQTVDISIMLCFMFWDVVYCARHKDTEYSDQIGSQKSNEIRGRFVGFAWDVGHALTFEILTDDTKNIISRSRVRLAMVGENNLKLDVEAGAIPELIYIRSKRDSETGDITLPTIDMSLNPFTTNLELPATVIRTQPKPSDDAQDGEQQTNTNQNGERPTERQVPPDTQPVTEPPAVETVDEEQEDDDEAYRSPFDSLPLREQPTVETVDDDKDIAEHLREHKKGSSTPEKPINFGTEFLGTEGPTEERFLSPEDMIDRSFLMPAQEDGTRVRAKILEHVKTYRDGLALLPEVMRFKCLINDDYQEIVDYNDIVDYVEQDQTWDGIWRFREILDHEGPYTPTHKRWMGHRYNFKVLWETGETTWRPLRAKDDNGDQCGLYDSDRVTVAIYAKKHDLLSKKGWCDLPGIKKLICTQKKIIRAANQAKLHSFRTAPIFMYGFQVPRNHAQALELDAANGNTRWQDTEKLELDQIDECDTFLDKGKDGGPGLGYKRINVHFVYAAKHDGRHKSRLVAGGHLTETPIDSVYSSVVSLKGIRILTFLAELNDCETWATDIGNAYLESFTQEKVYIKAGPEFGERAGHILVIVRALYGLKSSGLRWSERFADVLRSMGFFPSKAERDIWMRAKGDHYEYIAVYVDDLLIVSKDPQSIIDMLSGPIHKFKLKGTGPISFHLSCDFFRDDDGVLCYAPKAYIVKILENFKRLFGCDPKKYKSPLEGGDHPELDTSSLLEGDKIRIYQSLIGALQWVIQIGRFDIATAVMTLSRFRASTRTHGSCPPYLWIPTPHAMRCDSNSHGYARLQ